MDVLKNKKKKLVCIGGENSIIYVINIKNKKIIKNFKIH